MRDVEDGGDLLVAQTLELAQDEHRAELGRQRLDGGADGGAQLAVFEALNGNQTDTDRYFGVFAQTVPVTEFFDPGNLQRIVARA